MNAAAYGSWNCPWNKPVWNKSNWKLEWFKSITLNAELGPNISSVCRNTNPGTWACSCTVWSHMQTKLIPLTKWIATKEHFFFYSVRFLLRFLYILNYQSSWNFIFLLPCMSEDSIAPDSKTEIFSDSFPNIPWSFIHPEGLSYFSQLKYNGM